MQKVNKARVTFYFVQTAHFINFNCYICNNVLTRLLFRNFSGRNTTVHIKYINWWEGELNSSYGCLAAFSGKGAWHPKKCRKKTNLVICEAPGKRTST